MEDISPELLEKIRRDFFKQYKSNERVKNIVDTIVNGSSSYDTITKYTKEVGTMLSKSFEKVLKPSNLPDGKLYYNIAESTVIPMLKEVHSMVNKEVEVVQSQIFQNLGLNIQPQLPKFNEDRATNLIDRLTEYQTEDEDIDVSNNEWLLDDDSMVNFFRSEQNDAMELNSEFAEDAGLTSYITRSSGAGCCDWCDSMSGTYIYGDQPDDFFLMHKNCTCEINVRFSRTRWTRITFDTVDGKMVKNTQNNT